jgi:hypothetical protein
MEDSLRKVNGAEGGISQWGLQGSEGFA